MMRCERGMKGCKTMEAVKVLGAIKTLRWRVQAVIDNSRKDQVVTPSCAIQALGDALKEVDLVIDPLQDR